MAVTGTAKLDNLFDQYWEHTVLSHTTNSFTINLDTTNWPTWASGGFVAKQITMSSGSLPAKRCIAPQGQNLWQQLFLNGDPAYSVVIRGTYDAVFDALIIDRCPGTFGMGMPVEVMVKLANKLNVDPWFCLPHLCTDDYVTQFATYVRDHLNSNLVAYYELSNEVWNGSTRI